jgi:ubiquinone/menaquinone biosynthesis C-methylase UbiE
MSQVQPAEILREWRDSAKYWAKHSATIRRMFAPLTQALIEDAGIVPGQSVLDVAGGTGEPSLTIAETVGPTGSVMCTDAIAEMVEAARAEAGKRHLTNIGFRQCTAESLPFPDNSFDVVVSRLGVMFFPDPAFAQMVRVTKPGGVLAFVVWHHSELNPFSYVVADVLSRHVETPPADANAPGAFRFAELGKLAAVLTAAGASDVRQRVFKFDIAAPISPDEFWEMRSGTSETLRSKLAKLSDEERSQIAAEVYVAVKEFFPNNQMCFPAQMLIVTGRKPD